MLEVRVRYDLKDMVIPELGTTDSSEEASEETADKYSHGGDKDAASENSESLPEGLAEDSSLQDIVDVMAKDHQDGKPKVLVFFTNDGENMKHCRDLFATLANTVKYDCALALSHVFDVYRVNASKSFRYKAINQDKAPLLLVLDTKNKIVAKAGGNGKAVSGTQAFKALCKGAAKLGIKLAKAVKEQDALIQKICKVDQRITVLKSRISSEKSEKKRSKLKKDLAKLESELEELKAKEKELWAKIDKKIKEKSKA